MPMAVDGVENPAVFLNLNLENSKRCVIFAKINTLDRFP
jgi:hypothetical protein